MYVCIATVSLLKQGHPITIQTKSKNAMNGIIEKIELVVKRMRRKAFFHEYGTKKFITKNYSLKSSDCPTRP